MTITKLYITSGQQAWQAEGHTSTVTAIAFSTHSKAFLRFQDGSWAFDFMALGLDFRVQGWVRVQSLGLRFCGSGR